MKYSDITKLKHLAQDKISRSANPAIVRNSTIFFKSMQELLKQEKLVKKGLKVNFYEYGRGGSQTTIALQNFIADLEAAYATFLTSTGFGAVALAIMSICRPGDEIIVTDAVYAPTRAITSKLLREFKVKTHFYNPVNINTLKSKINKRTKMIFVENPGSNTFEFQDLSKIIGIAKKRKIITVIDNTWGTPFFIKPLKIGFDMSISSGTKYLSGHSDVMLGSLSVSKKVYEKVRFCNKLLGYRASPDDAYLVLRGLRTLDVRLKKHEENTKKIVNFLKKEKKIKEILYPHKKGSENYENWKKYYSGSTGLFSVIISSKNRNSIYKFVNSLKLFGIGQSWGGFESLVLYQNQVIQRVYKKYIKSNHHIVRFHIGLEDPKDLIEDLRKAIKKIK
jgi:cystathionine beta-lyase|tara:strand:- start:14385 stop:15560 length:1176 start_codon:yes stop_codon:yes gene_type:complete